MKKKWVAPRTEVQKFEANEYVAACWGVACDTEAANDYDKWYAYHNPNECGSFTQQVIYDDNNDGVADRMIENRNGGLACKVYEDPNYSILKKVSDVNIGETVYWTTKLGLITYHHQGTVLETVPGHPNRS